MAATGIPSAPQYIPPRQPPVWIPTAWQSVPAFVRFAIWLWSIGMVVSVVVGVIFGIVIAAHM